MANEGWKILKIVPETIIGARARARARARTGAGGRAGLWAPTLSWALPTLGTSPKSSTTLTTDGWNGELEVELSVAMKSQNKLLFHNDQGKRQLFHLLE